MWVWVLVLSGYVVGALITFRRVYLSELEDYYKDRLERARCTECNGSRELCLKHHLADDDSVGPVTCGVFVAIIWPLIAVVMSLYLTVKTIGVGVRKILFPKGINTPSKQKYIDYQESKKLKEETAKLRVEIQKLGLDPDTLLPDPDKTPADLAKAVSRDIARRGLSAIELDSAATARAIAALSTPSSHRYVSESTSLVEMASILGPEQYNSLRGRLTKK